MQYLKKSTKTDILPGSFDWIQNCFVASSCRCKRNSSTILGWLLGWTMRTSPGLYLNNGNIFRHSHKYSRVSYCIILTWYLIQICQTWPGGRLGNDQPLSHGHWKQDEQKMENHVNRWGLVVNTMLLINQSIVYLFFILNWDWCHSPPGPFRMLCGCCFDSILPST